MNPVIYLESPAQSGIFRSIPTGSTVVIYRDSDMKGWTIDKPPVPSFYVERLHDGFEGGFYYRVRYCGGTINGTEWATAKTARDLRRLIRNATR
ncbi:MAG: hypothetical protein ACK5NX_03060 [Armatimonadota bacterium]